MAGPSAAAIVLYRLPGAANLHGYEVGGARTGTASCELRYRLPFVFDPCRPSIIGATTMGYGLGWASAAAFNTKETNKRTISMMGDGGFWHNGLTSGVGNAVFNQSDNVLVVVDNSYTAATGGQDILSSAAQNPIRTTKLSIADAVRGVGVKWVRTVTRTYDVAKMRDVLKEALTTKEKGPKVIVAQSECTLNKQRRVKPLMNKMEREGKRVVREQLWRRSRTPVPATTPAFGFPAVLP